MFALDITAAYTMEEARVAHVVEIQGNSKSSGCSHRRRGAIKNPGNSPQFHTITNSFCMIDEVNTEWGHLYNFTDRE